MEEATLTLYDYLSSAKAATNRRIIKVIRHGGVSVDEVVVDDPNHLISSNSKILFEGKEIPYVFRFVIMLNKPKGYMCSTIDERYPSVFKLLPPDMASRAVMSGRLDHDTEGLLIFSDSGRLSTRLVHPSYGLEKEYEVYLDKPLKDEDFAEIYEKGTDFAGEIVKPSSLLIKNNERTLINIVVKEGKYHEIKRIFYRRGYSVLNLKRIRFDFLSLDNLEVGSWRFLTKEEEERLFRLVDMERVKRANSLKRN